MGKNSVTDICFLDDEAAQMIEDNQMCWQVGVSCGFQYGLQTGEAIQKMILPVLEVISLLFMKSCERGKP